MSLDTDLIRYAKEGDLTGVQQCIENGATAIDFALWIASGGNNLKIVEYLVREKANVNVDIERNRIGLTALMHASEKGSIEVVEFLIQKGANIDAENIDMKTALMYATENERVEIVAFLIQRKADVNIQNISGGTAFDVASEWGLNDIVEMIQKHNTKINNESTNDDKITAINKLVDTHFGGSIKETAKFIFEYVLNHQK